MLKGVTYLILVDNFSQLYPEVVKIVDTSLRTPDGEKVPIKCSKGGYTLDTSWPYLKEFRLQDKEFKLKQKLNFDCRHRAHPLPDIPDGTEV